MPGFTGPIPSAALDKVLLSCSSDIIILDFLNVNGYTYPTGDFNCLQLPSKGGSAAYLGGFEEEDPLTERKFTVIKGGAAAALSSNRRKFLSGFITDTRLMGVVGLYIRWELSNMEFVSDFHQFFYFDAEEYGFETYKSLLGSDPEALTIMEQALIGGLGGSKVNVSEREAAFLVQKFVAMNETLNISLPDGKGEYGFLLDEPVVLSEKEHEILIDKLCTPIVSEYQLINYFLMRVSAEILKRPPG